MNDRYPNTIAQFTLSLLVCTSVLATACTKQKKRAETPEQTQTQPRTVERADKPNVKQEKLRALDEFSSIKDEKERALAIYDEIDTVLSHPRCVNCHPAGDSPYQGPDITRIGDTSPKPHQPLVVRGEDGFGAAGMRCETCHGEANFENVPGSPGWHLAPIEMAWEGKTPGAICEQIKDPERNGGKTLAQLTEHMQHDALVGYGWNPPAHLQPAPGSQKIFGELFAAWIEAGAPCPPVDRPR